MFITIKMTPMYLTGVLDYLEEELEFVMRSKAVPAFWSRCMQANAATVGDDFSAAVNELYVLVVSDVIPMANRMDGLASDTGVDVYLHGQHSYIRYSKVPVSLLVLTLVSLIVVAPRLLIFSQILI